MKIKFVVDKLSWCSRDPKAFYLKIIIFLVIVFLILALNKSVCVYFPIFMWLRGDACDTWRATGLTRWSEDADYTWWQRACILESDWQAMDYVCKDLRLMGNWPVCFDEPYSPVKKNKPCIVYSFGIAYDFDFDEAMAYFNCTVYSFDPSMRAADHMHTPKRELRGHNTGSIYFKNLGLGGFDDTNFRPRSDGYAKSTDRWQILTLKSIMKMLGHSPQSISVLKIDIENNEWAVLSNLLEEGILQQLPQFLVEWHIFPDSPPHDMYKKMHEDYGKMKKLGFRKFWMRNEGRNHWLPKFLTQAETAYINSNYKHGKA